MKNPHAVALGRLGGERGGPVRAKSLSSSRRVEIAKAAIWTRWHFLDRLRSDRAYRQKISAGISRKSGVDAGDVEHSLFSLTQDPSRRLARCLSCR